MPMKNPVEEKKAMRESYRSRDKENAKIFEKRIRFPKKQKAKVKLRKSQ